MAKKRLGRRSRRRRSRTSSQTPQSANTGNRCRRKGHREELRIRNKFQDVGFARAATSRSASNETDARKIDLVRVGRLAPQVKQWKNYVPMNTIHEIVLKDNEIPLLFSREDNAREGLVCMRESDFFEMLATFSVSDSTWVRRVVEDPHA